MQFLHVIMDDPPFAGPTRHKLHVPRMADLVEAAITKALDEQPS